MYLDSVSHLTGAQNLYSSKETTYLLHSFRLLHIHLQIVLAIQKISIWKCWQQIFYNQNRAWLEQIKNASKPVRQRLPPWQEQVVEESTIWHKCFECDPNEHNWFTTTWYPYTLWGCLFQWMLCWEINQHREIFLLVLINEICHLCARCMVLYSLQTSYRCRPL